MNHRVYFAVLLVLQLAVFINAETQPKGELPDVIRRKVQKLIDEKKIKRDYEPYVEPELKDEEEYDFVIVGSGSGGSSLINRLSEIKKWKILVLEAGGDPDILTDMPIWAPLAHFTDQNWRFYTEQEDNFALGFKNKRMHWPRGKGIGGSSLLNYMVFSRGAIYDYDRWGSLGNPGWSYKELLPYFKKMERCKIGVKDDEVRGKQGELHVEDSKHRTKGVEIFLEAAKASGYKYVDYNGKEHVGVSYVQSTTKDGLRCSGERCFIRNAKNRDNLTIRTKSHVTKVIIDENKKAKGVEFVKNGKTYKVFAKKEVILCAGVINSAHLLMLSGVGLKSELERFGIEVKQDLPVGKKIYDHPAYWGLTFTVNEKLDVDRAKLFDDETYINLYNKGTGSLHNTGGLEGVVFSTTTATTHKNLSDIEILYWSTHLGSQNDYGLGASMELSPEIYNKIYLPLKNKNILSAFPILMRPESYGRLELRSKDPFKYPKIYGGYFTDPKGVDMKTMIAGIRETIRIFTAEPFQKYDVKVVDTKIPGCEEFLYDTDQYWECAVRHLTSTLYHHTTTCKMGPKNDPEAVVDHRLRVYGIENLRVADTSVIPVQITGHTNVPAYLVGEKAAALIIEDHIEKDNLKVEL
nr:glucose dehydrogenase [FAD, quinone]-like [Onthophagus taurus]